MVNEIGIPVSINVKKYPVRLDYRLLFPLDGDGGVQGIFAEG